MVTTRNFSLKETATHCCERKGDTVYIKGQGEDVTLIGGTAILADNDSLIINGGNDTVAIGNNETLTANGGEYTISICRQINSSVTSTATTKQYLYQEIMITLLQMDNTAMWKYPDRMTA